ncbi:MAG: DNA alkylation repair protein [Muribaculaceae bacterium]
MIQSKKESEIRKQFFAYRNGMLADALRGAGNCHTVIFGLTLQQVIELANAVGKDAQLANDLWNDIKCREARLIAPLLMPADVMDFEVAKAWCDTVEDSEICDVLCHRLLRNLPFAFELVEHYAHSAVPLQRYLAMRLLINLVAIGKPIDTNMVSAMASEALSDDDVMVRQVSKMIVDNLADLK